MKYMIIHWSSNFPSGWKILHYSHSWNDVQTQLIRLRKEYPDCELMVNYEEIRTEDRKKAVKDMLAQIMETIKCRMKS